jgi:hypothetical protein
MKWIKASERIPANSIPVYVKCAHGKRILYSTPLGWLDFETNQVYLCHDDINESSIFWLDESIPSEKKYTEEERDKFAINFGVWLIGRPVTEVDLEPYKKALNEK